MAWGKCSLAGASQNLPSSCKVPVPETLHFLGKQSIPRERESDFQGKIIPQRENFPSEGGKFAQFSLGGKIWPQKMFRVVPLKKHSSQKTFEPTSADVPTAALTKSVSRPPIFRRPIFRRPPLRCQPFRAS